MNRQLSKYICNFENIPNMDTNLDLLFLALALWINFHSECYKNVIRHGKSIYGQKLILQKNSRPCITKPTFTQSEHSLINHDVPAKFHSDFPTEISVLVPFTPLTKETNHTSIALTAIKLVILSLSPITLISKYLILKKSHYLEMQGMWKLWMKPGFTALK